MYVLQNLDCFLPAKIFACVCGGIVLVVFLTYLGINSKLLWSQTFMKMIYIFGKLSPGRVVEQSAKSIAAMDFYSIYLPSNSCC